MKQISTTDPMKSLANIRGRLYLSHARTHMTDGDMPKALSLAEEGLRLTTGPFYISVRDELSDMVAKLRIASAVTPPH